MGAGVRRLGGQVADPGAQRAHIPPHVRAPRDPHPVQGFLFLSLSLFVDVLCRESDMESHATCTGKDIHLGPEAEEWCTYYAVSRELQHYDDPVFRENFFRDWREVLKKDPEGKVIKDLDGCNFDSIWEWHLAEKERKAALTKEEKKVPIFFLLLFFSVLRWCSCLGGGEKLVDWCKRQDRGMRGKKKRRCRKRKREQEKERGLEPGH